MVGTSRDMKKGDKEKKGQSMKVEEESSWEEASARVSKRNDIALVTTTDKK